TTANPAPTRLAASALPMLPSPTTPTVSTSGLRDVVTVGAELADHPTRRHTRGTAGVRDELVEQLVDLRVADPGARGGGGVQPELLHPTCGGGDGEPQQAAVERREGSLAGPHPPRGRRDEV